MKVDFSFSLVSAENLVQGKWTPGPQSAKVFSPHNGREIGTMSAASVSLVEQCLESAASAQKDWHRTPIKERSKALYRLREILLAKQDLITNVKCAESGKIFEEGKAGLLKGIEVLEFALSLQNLDVGGKLEVSRGVTCEYRRDPLGVVACISPFNFPAMVPLWTIPIALVLGNAVVWKPSDKTPLTSRLIGEALCEAGIPAGVFSILQGGAEVAQTLCTHSLVKAVSFVGSTKVAEQVYFQATSHKKRALALGGAKNHIILLPDADPQLSGVGISDSFTGCAGQRCMAASVLLAVGNVDAHIEAILERAKSQRLGETMGAIISQQQLQFLRDNIENAKAQGAKLLLDGRTFHPPKSQEQGNWLGPTVLDEVKPGSIPARVELFGPILSIIRCKDLSEALAIQQTSEYGNACSVFTANGALADRVVREAKAGMMGVNVGVPVPREPFSFGGVDDSKFGTGDITGVHSLDFWTQLKKITTKWEGQKDSNWMS